MMANKRTSRKKAPPVKAILQMKIMLKHSKPPIWRRVLIPDNYDLLQLHHVIQVAMGWTDSHLHQYIIDGEYYSIPHRDDWAPTFDERKVILREIPKARFTYEYDFGDSWGHVITIEKTLEPDPAMTYPRCIKGRRACPPEDCGGIWGYMGLIEALNDPSHPDHEQCLEWLGGPIDPEEFDIESINYWLAQLGG